MLYGMDPNTASKQWPMYIQPDIVRGHTYDLRGSLVPGPRYDVFQLDRPTRAELCVPRCWSTPRRGASHVVLDGPLQRRLDETLGTTGLDAWNSWYDRFFDTFTSRTCHGHSLPCNVTGACVSQEDAKMLSF
ncbi:hypothetical protein M404DRAFT_614890 [Pisolithus tinctorius Marx 270]|uniref:Uncharacterized protein n=1 Tax=Pisolithus tinctorius Marx 270 TaxID=870435 RepID=A0A0C3J3Q3_PISTI|nr:hypothetical protein M404DRAFT_614890 [Pisolithus tinctorius Marx 270]